MVPLRKGFAAARAAAATTGSFTNAAVASAHSAMRAKALPATGSLRSCATESISFALAVPRRQATIRVAFDIHDAAGSSTVLLKVACRSCTAPLKSSFEYRSARSCAALNVGSAFRSLAAVWSLHDVLRIRTSRSQSSNALTARMNAEPDFRRTREAPTRAARVESASIGLSPGPMCEASGELLVPSSEPELSAADMT